MLIERQGKNGFVNFDKVVLIDTTVDTEGYANVFVRYENGGMVVLGQYRTEEKADAVVQEIVEKYENEARTKTYKMP
nr:hypothetical protein [uncultured Oscillibacter sp.]